MTKQTILTSLILLLLLPSCGGSNSQGKKQSEPYNLIQILYLDDLQYINRKEELIYDQGFADGAEWAKKEKQENGESQMKTKAIESFTQLYGTPEGMTDNESDQDIYERFRNDYVKSFSEGCRSVW